MNIVLGFTLWTAKKLCVFCLCFTYFCRIQVREISYSVVLTVYENHIVWLNSLTVNEYI